MPIINTIFTDSHLRTILRQGESEDKKIRPKKITEKMFCSAKKEQYLPIYLESIMKANAKKLLAKFEKNYIHVQNSLSQPCQEAIHRMRFSAAEHSYSQFANESCLLGELSHKADKIRAHDFETAK